MQHFPSQVSGLAFLGQLCWDNSFLIVSLGLPCHNHRLNQSGQHLSLAATSHRFACFLAKYLQRRGRISSAGGQTHRSWARCCRSSISFASDGGRPVHSYGGFLRCGHVAEREDNQLLWTPTKCSKRACATPVHLQLNLDAASWAVFVENPRTYWYRSLFTNLLEAIPL